MSRLLRSFRSVIFIQKRFRYKKKWATYQKKKSPSELALEHFDQFYKPVYGELWPSIRIALLSQRKYCALVNNFSQADDVVLDLIVQGADDFIKLARDVKLEENSDVRTKYVGSGEREETGTSQNVSVTGEGGRTEIGTASRHVGTIEDGGRAGFGTASKHMGTIEEGGWTEIATATHNTNLYDFVPPQRVLSDREKLAEVEVERGFYRRDCDSDVKVLPKSVYRVPQLLRACVFERGNVDLFSPPKKDLTGKLGYYLMDAASLLPVVALDLEPSDKVLDLCAAPGGKSLTIIQTMLPSRLICVDSSYARIGRMKEVLRWYVPKSHLEKNEVQIFHGDALAFARDVHRDFQFDKVLVDVPCYTDRHVLSEDENSLFRPHRASERHGLQGRQKALLVAALQCCRPGGSVVYSTCTLSMPQNDGVVQAALEHLWQRSDLQAVVEDTSVITRRFKQTFNFYPKCRYGQLVLPNLVSNFGPTYFCRIKRLK